MRNHFIEGNELKNKIKELVYDYISKTPNCGLRTSEIFRGCGLDWGEQENAASSTQQYWVVALLRELERDGKIVRNAITKRWYKT